MKGQKKRRKTTVSEEITMLSVFSMEHIDMTLIKQTPALTFHLVIYSLAGVSATTALVPARKSDPVNDALILLLIQKRISQLEVQVASSCMCDRHTSASGDKESRGDQKESSRDQEEEQQQQTRVTAGSRESRDMIFQLEQRQRDGRENQQLVRSFQHEGMGSKALPSQYVHKQGAAFDSRMAENRHHTGSHYVMAGGVQFQRGVRVKGVVSRHSKQAAVRNGPVGGGAQNMKKMGLLNEQRETGKKGAGTGGGGKKSKKKCRKNPSSV
jgi:hypothetical protein